MLTTSTLPSPVSESDAARLVATVDTPAPPEQLVTATNLGLWVRLVASKKAMMRSRNVSQNGRITCRGSQGATSVLDEESGFGATERVRAPLAPFDWTAPGSAEASVSKGRLLPFCRLLPFKARGGIDMNTGSPSFWLTS